MKKYFINISFYNFFNENAKKKKKDRRARQHKQHEKKMRVNQRSDLSCSLVRLNPNEREKVGGRLT